MILPVQIACLTTMLVVASVYLLLWRYRSVAVAMQGAAAAAVVSFIPILMIVGEIVDSRRYGQFQFERAAEVGDPYVRLPDSATGITLHKYASGHEVRFTVDPPALANWMESVAQSRRDESGKPTPFQESPTDWDRGATRFQNAFGRHGWTMPDDIVRYDGWRSPRGGGFDVWYSPSAQEGYIRAGYW